MSKKRRIAIYMRSSSRASAEESCAEQEKLIRAGLTKNGIDHGAVFVLRDDDCSGVRGGEFAELRALIAAREIGLLVVDDMSRLGRGANSAALIAGLVRSGGDLNAVQDRVHIVR
jgi:DNA invertase Pin-like site-specific DNA recombinase